MSERTMNLRCPNCKNLIEVKKNNIKISVYKTGIEIYIKCRECSQETAVDIAHQEFEV